MERGEEEVEECSSMGKVLGVTPQGTGGSGEEVEDIIATIGIIPCLELLYLHITSCFSLSCIHKLSVTHICTNYAVKTVWLVFHCQGISPQDACFPWSVGWSVVISMSATASRLCCGIVRFGMDHVLV